MTAQNFPREHVSKWVPRSQSVLVTLIIMTSFVDSVLLGYDGSIMGSLNTMKAYTNYFTLTTSTTSLLTAASYLGGCIMAPLSGFITDWRGRRETILWSCIITLLGVILQTASVNIAMFIIGRIVIGGGSAVAATATPIYVVETSPPKFRAFAMGLYYTCWGVGTLIASGICYGTQDYVSTWAWRAPSVFQAAAPIFCMVILLFLPHSPRELIKRDQHDHALEVLAIVNAGGDKSDPAVLLQYHEIADTIAFEKSGGGRQLTMKEAWVKPGNRKRLIIAISFAAIVMLPGTNIITYYFGTMMTQAGITDSRTQLEINCIMTAWGLIIAMLASYYTDKFRRKTMVVSGLIGGIVALFLFAGLDAVYGNGSSNKSGIYATIGMMFLYVGTYSWGITPPTVLIPAEVLSYDIRATGMSAYTMGTKLCGLFVTFVFPYALDAITWKTYIINSCFDILMVLFVAFYYVETRGLTLEEIDSKFDGVKHSDVPDLEQLKAGKAKLVIEGIPVGGKGEEITVSSKPTRE
ncbi:MAG: hypothetical protein M1834_004478 [Cirrosporium novae-zelandiae]|nr:MAG: hypothetical protein M1834_004478 [Cirrosporium novae-zelandiae]